MLVFFFVRKGGEGTCLMVIAGLQSFSSSSSDRHTVPEGYTFGWNSGGSNLPVTASGRLVISMGPIYHSVTKLLAQLMLVNYVITNFQSDNI